MATDKKKVTLFERRHTRKICVNFVSNERGLCNCGYLQSEHLYYDDVKRWSKGREWREELHVDSVEYGPTGFNCKVKFVSQVDNFERLADMTVIANDSHPAVALQHLRRDWGLRLPNIVISVAGSQTNLHFIARHAARLKHGLMRAVCSTPTWVITGGTSSGVDQLVLDGLKQAQIMAWMGSGGPEFHVIGFPNFNCVAQHEQMSRWIHTEREKAFTYVVKANRHSDHQFSPSLNPFISHFLCIEGGIRGVQGQEVAVRSAVEDTLAGDPRTISEYGEAGCGLPTVLVLIKGEFDVLERAANAVSKGIGIVVCEGLGGASDILYHAMRMSNRNSSQVMLTRSQELSLVKQMEVMLNQPKQFHRLYPDQPFEAARHMHHVKTCIRTRHLVFFYRCLRPGDTFDTVVIKALLAGSATQRTDPLELAMKWDKCDHTIRDIIVHDNDDINCRPSIRRLFIQAVMNGQLDFIQMFIDLDLDIPRTVTTEAISQLYQHACAKSPALTKMMNTHAGRLCGQREEFSLNDVYKVVEGSTSVRPRLSLLRQATQSQPKFDDPARELCLYAVLTNKPALAEYFWAKTKNPVAMGLICHKLWSEVKHAIDLKDEKTVALLDHHSRDFMVKSMDVMRGCWEASREMADQVLRQPIPQLNQFTTLEIAAMVDCQQFIALPCCQSAVDNAWRGGMKCCTRQVIKNILLPISLRKLQKSRDQTPPDLNQYMEEDCRNTEKAQTLGYKKQSRFRVPARLRSSSIVQGKERLDEGTGGEVRMEGGSCRETEGTPHTSSVRVGQSMHSPDELQFVKGDWETLSTASCECSQSRGGKEEEAMDMSYVEMLLVFYSAPLTKFVIHATAYVLFLLLLTVSVTELDSRGRQPTLLCGTLLVYLLSYAAESLRRLVSRRGPWLTKAKLWARNEWNLMEACLIATGLTSIGLRLADASAFLPAILTLYCATAFLAWVSLLRFYQCSSKLGPIWIMIKHMMAETLVFMCICGLMIVPVGVCLFCIHVNRGSSHFLSQDSWILLRPYFIFTGNFFTKYIDEEYGRNIRLTMWLNWSLMFVGNMLMINLLVAMYNGVFVPIMLNADQTWKTQMYWLLREFQDKTFLPPPVSMAESVLLTVRSLVRSSRQRPSAVAEERASRLEQFQTRCLGAILERKSQDKSSDAVVAEVMANLVTRTGKVEDTLTVVQRVGAIIESEREAEEERRREQFRNQTLQKP